MQVSTYQLKWIRHFMTIHDYKARNNKLNIHLSKLNSNLTNLSYSLKLLRDPLYYIYADDPTKALDHGYFFTNEGPTPPCRFIFPSYNFRPINRKKDNNIVLFTTGAFNPFHDGHLSMMLKAEEFVSKKYNVLGCVFIPNHSVYLNKKSGLKPTYDDKYLEMNRLLKSAPSHYQISRVSDICHNNDVPFSEIGIALLNCLKKKFNSNLTIGYVYGGNLINISPVFNSAFKGICVARKKDLPKTVDNPNVSLINIHDKTSLITSKEILNKLTDHNPYYTERHCQYYFLRDDLRESSEIYSKHERYESGLSYFRYKLIRIFDKYTPYKLITVNLNKQIANISKHKFKYPTLSLDIYFKGDYRLDITRAFTPGLQYSNSTFVNREGTLPLEQQLALIPKQPLTFIDDDKVTSATLDYVKKYLDIREEYYLTKSLSNEIYDVAEMRDFLFGAKYGGLFIKIKNHMFRLPYIEPFVNLHARARIEDARHFSIDILNLNIDFLSYINSNYTVKQIYGSVFL